MATHGPEVCTDHYVFWTTTPTQVDQEVKVQGQFNPEPFATRLPVIELLGNPAVKRHKPPDDDIHHASVHLLAYRMSEQSPGPKEPVIIRNQFTDPEGQRWSLGVTQFLLVPARKALVDEPPPETPPLPRVDHFLLYEVRDAPLVPGFVSLRDQFGVTDTHELRPVFLGVPADKNGEGLIHPDVHLAIYELRPGLHPQDAISVRTFDQFGRHSMRCIESVFLGVPSLKEWKH